MNIGIIIGRIGGVDGVALETEKWIEVLRRMGHELFLLAGLYEKDILNSEKQTLLPMLSFFSPECQWEQQKAFLQPDHDQDPEPLLNGIIRNSETIAEAILNWLQVNNISVLIVENASALPLHLSMGIGILKAVEQSGIKTITHDHDFAWERGSRYESPFQEINKVVALAFPLRIPWSRHAVINSDAARALKEWFNREAVLVPNVMDFDVEYGRKTEYNSTLLTDTGLSSSDILLLQVTRVVRRKGIETAFELVKRLDNPRYKLLITGSHRDDEGGLYYKDLLDIIHRDNLSEQIIFAADLIRNDRISRADGKKVYDLSDAYAYGRACTYFSDYEGFGNAFVEAVLARKPIFVNNYKPVFWPEIGSKGFKVVMIEDNQLTDQAVKDIKEIIDDPDLCREIAEFNFELGKKHFSYDVLQEKLAELLG